MYVVIRIRGNVRVRDKLEDTLGMLRLNRVNHAVLVPEGKQYKNMVRKVEPFITYGEINVEMLEKMLAKRGKTETGKKLTSEFLKEIKFASMKDLADAVISGKTTLKKLGIKPVFRLHPPKKGHMRQGIKKNYSLGGAAGYRASDINVLVKKMI
ncbi:MAG: 50S ribosomal protein L30 [Candidatus Diapherotrites archaeon]